ncbi:hypothetical protein BH10ACI2_BH10ACI2_12160 [soil metagenome]
MKNVLFAFVILTVLFSLSAAAQTKKNVKPVKPLPNATPAATPAPTPEPVEPAVKRNERPSGEKAADAKKNAASKGFTPTYFYQFERPGFTYPKILIEHDEAGKGSISFMKDGYEEMLTDPIELSAATIANINGALTELNFLDSTADYQYPKDFSNMGNVTFTFKKEGRERTIKYNWTEVKPAKVLMDEYRSIGNEYTWKFELIIARENQPLLTPSLMDAIDSYLQRREISDPPHLVPFLTQLSTDERMPLMARNHATKLIKQIEKPKK